MSQAPRCLVIHPGALGDVLASLPALAHLSGLGFERVLAAVPRLAAFLVEAGAVEQAIDFERLELQGLFMEPPAADALDALGRYEAIVSWFGVKDPAYRRHLLSLGLEGRQGPGRPVGPNGGTSAVPRVVVAGAAPPPGVCRPVSRHLADTLAPLGLVPAVLPEGRLRVSEPARVWAADWLAARGLFPGEAIVLHPGAGSPIKIWPGFAMLARRLLEAGWPIVVSAGPADGAIPEGIPDARVARAPTLSRLAALLALARAFVGNDSGPSHLAAAVRCPTLALFGPTDPAVWAPQGPCVSVLAGAGPGTRDPWAGLTPERVTAALGVLVDAASASAPLGSRVGGSVDVLRGLATGGHS